MVSLFSKISFASVLFLILILIELRHMKLLESWVEVFINKILLDMRSRCATYCFVHVCGKDGKLD